MLVHPVVRATGTIRRRRTTNKDLSTPRTVSWLRLPPSVLRPASVGRDARRARLAFTLLHTKIYVRNFAQKHNVEGDGVGDGEGEGEGDGGGDGGGHGL